MTAKITVEKISDREMRITLVADIQVSWDVPRVASGADTMPVTASGPDIRKAVGEGGKDGGLLTVEETAELLRIGRDKIYYLIRTGQLRSMKIGKSRRISRAWIEEFIERQPLGGR